MTIQYSTEWVPHNALNLVHGRPRLELWKVGWGVGKGLWIRDDAAQSRRTEELNQAGMAFAKALWGEKELATLKNWRKASGVGTRAQGRVAWDNAGERAPGGRWGRPSVNQPVNYTRPLPGHIRGKPILMKHGNTAKGGTIHKEIVIIKAEAAKCTSLPLWITLESNRQNSELSTLAFHYTLVRATGSTSPPCSG